MTDSEYELHSASPGWYLHSIYVGERQADLVGFAQ